MTSSRIRILSGGAAMLLLTATVAFTAEDASHPKKNRQSPTGYSDTPVIPGQKWKVHDIDRPKPRVVTPGTASTPDKPGLPPSDAIVLFDGKDLSKWVSVKKGVVGAPGWKVEHGYVEVTDGSGDISTKEKFGDMQLHVEWAAPAEVDGTSQWRGNSGIMIMGRYEIQVLDSYNNPTYADGQAGAIYGQWPPLVNASRKPGEWQTYDIVWEAPKFEGTKVVKQACVTVFHNGVLVQNHKELIGRTPHRIVGTYEPHGAEEPLTLQNHDTYVRYRNIWARRLTGYDQQ